MHAEPNRLISTTFPIWRTEKRRPISSRHYQKSNLHLRQCSTQGMLFRATACAARSKFAVYHYGGDATDAQSLSPPSPPLLVYFVEFFIIIRTPQPPLQI